MFKLCFGLFLLSLFCLFSSGYASSSQFTSANQIMITNHGIMVNIEGQVKMANSVVHVGNGVYEISEEYYGTCGRCGWALDKNGKCTNQNCNQYGPREH